MNDRFKFRVWNNKMQKFHIVFSMHGIVNDTLEGYAKDDNFVLEQCTGLKDKNGNLIYEGDILGGIYGGYISWCDECKSFELFVPEYGCASCSGDVLWQDIVEDDGMLEIIGNIHENADLLENEE